MQVRRILGDADALYEHQQDSDDALDDAHLLRYAAAAGADPAIVERDWARVPTWNACAPIS